MYSPLTDRQCSDVSLSRTVISLRGDGRVGRQEVERLSPSRKVVSSMAKPSHEEQELLLQTKLDELEGCLLDVDYELERAFVALNDLLSFIKNRSS